MIDWQNTAKSVIAEVAKSLPYDADLKTRRAALRKAKPYEFSATSWGSKVWAKHQRIYLEKFGLEPLDKAAPKSHLSPLEAMMAKAKKVEGEAAAAASPALPTDSNQATRHSRDTGGEVIDNG